jgi:hypothetical protein
VADQPTHVRELLKLPHARELRALAPAQGPNAGGIAHRPTSETGFAGIHEADIRVFIHRAYDHEEWREFVPCLSR